MEFRDCGQGPQGRPACLHWGPSFILLHPAGSPLKEQSPPPREEGNTNNPCPAPTGWGSGDAAGTQGWGLKDLLSLLMICVSETHYEIPRP